ncbi:glycosyltransferase family 2 protein [Paenibacillus thailandensis]|uniref:Glycosyltransferase family 2 protein n=1 Tax=Paenibacillus thailandensis TaxID=393250 RepID=A0ABW5QSJ4_9BACL
MDRILLFIPMYNCENQISRVIEKIKKSEVYVFLNEIIIIDNHSKDNSIENARRAIEKNDCRKARVVKNHENVGLGGTHKSAFKYAVQNNFDYVIVLHGDDQGDISDFSKVISEREYRKWDAVLGSRFMKGSSTPGYSKFRIFGNLVFNKIVSIITRRKIYDLGSGLNMYRVNALSEPFYLRYPDNLVFNVYMLMGHTSLSHKLKFYPISWREEDQVSNVKLFSQTKYMTKSLLLYLVKRNKFLNGRDHRTKTIESYYFNEL